MLHEGTGTGTAWSLMDFDAEEIARQLTLMDWDIFVTLQPHELLEGHRIARGESWSSIFDSYSERSINSGCSLL
jgi:hypothetical protein